MVAWRRGKRRASVRVYRNNFCVIFSLCQLRGAIYASLCTVAIHDIVRICLAKGKKKKKGEKRKWEERNLKEKKIE